MADSSKNGNNRIITVLLAVVILSVIISAVVIVLYYVKQNRDKELENKGNKLNYVDISEDRINLLLKHISLLDPMVEINSLVQMKDIDENQKLRLIIEDLIETYDYKKDDDGHIIIQSDDILKRALKMFDIKTYDYYPEEIDYYNYHFEKQGTKYIGTEGDNKPGEYHYLDINPLVDGDKLYVLARVGYYEDKNGAYSDSIKSQRYCEGEGCIKDVDLSQFQSRDVYASYKIINNNFIFISATVSEIVPE